MEANPSMPFTVLESAAADALFESGDSCSSPAGYTVAVPDGWFTNAAVGDVPPCSWFSPIPFQLDGTEKIPADVAIGLSIVRTGLGQIPELPRILHEEVTIAGFTGFRSEDMIPGDPPDFAYSYAAWLDADPTGLKLLGSTGTTSAGDYALNKAVLDRMMASLQLGN